MEWLSPENNNSIARIWRVNEISYEANAAGFLSISYRYFGCASVLLQMGLLSSRLVQEGSSVEDEKDDEGAIGDVIVSGEGRYMAILRGTGETEELVVQVLYKCLETEVEVLHRAALRRSHSSVSDAEVPHWTLSLDDCMNREFTDDSETLIVTKKYFRVHSHDNTATEEGNQCTTFVNASIFLYNFPEVLVWSQTKSHTDVHGSGWSLVWLQWIVFQKSACLSWTICRVYENVQCQTLSYTREMQTILCSMR